MKTWPFSRRRIPFELALIVAFNLLCYVLFRQLELFERVDSWLHAHPSSQMDEALLLGLTMTVSLALFAARRLRELNRLLKSLRRQADHDDTTGLANRRYANRTLLRETERSRRSQHHFSILLIDLDHFKQVNDCHGHLAGDRVLHACATLLKRRARQLDTVARWGGEEFLLICPETGQAGALALAQDIRQRLAGSDFPHAGDVTASIGVATLNDDDTPDSLVHRADNYLYAAKQAGRNQVVGEPTPPPA